MLEAFADLSTPLVADACLRCGVPLRAAHSGIRPVVAGQGIAGRVLPVRHYGSVDVFLASMSVRFLPLAAIRSPTASPRAVASGAGARRARPTDLLTGGSGGATAVTSSLARTPRT